MSEAVERVLLSGKLLPPSREGASVTRPRLTERLESGLAGRCTLVTAGPGYGKTSLVADFIHTTNEDVVWYWLDDSDEDPWLLFQYLLRGVREFHSDFGARSAGLWSSLRAEGEPERLADTFIREAEETLPGRIVLVLDGIHVLEPREKLRRAVARLVRYLPGSMHLILIGRTEPDLGLRSQRMRGSASVIEADDLRFSVSETAQLMQLHGTEADQASIDSLQRRTGGWIAALQLMAARWGRGPELPENLFERSEPEIFEYLTEEVLGTLSPDARRLLLASALPSSFDARLLAVIDVVDREKNFARLVELKPFVSLLDSHRDIYEHTPLFRSFLLRRIDSEFETDQVAQIHADLARALEERGELARALEHARSSGDEALLARLLVSHGQALLHGGLIGAVRDAASMVLHSGQDDPVLEHLLGETCRVAGDFATAAQHYSAALAHRERLGERRTAVALQGMAYSSLRLGNLQRANDMAKQALDLTNEQEPALLARILNTIAIVSYRTGDHTGALEDWNRALLLSRRAGDEHLTSMVAHNLGLPHAVRGEFRRAADCFRILTGADNPRLGPVEGNAFLNLARLATLQGEFTEAASLLDDADEIARKWGVDGLAADVLEAKGHLLRDSGHHEQAAEKYSQARRAFTEMGLVGYLHGLEEEEAVLLARQGRMVEAKSLAASLTDKARKSEDAEQLASSLLALGETLCRAGDDARAVEALTESSKLFRELGRLYQHSVALLYSALAEFRRGRVESASEIAPQALKLSSEFGYEFTVRRIAAIHEPFAEWLAGLSNAPPPQPGKNPQAELAPVGAAADLRVNLLGPIQVFRDAEHQIPASAWKLKRALKIFCYLCVARQHRATKDTLADIAWSNARPSVIEKNFHPTISFLRRALNHGHKETKNFIVFEGSAYRFSGDYEFDLDVDRFQKHVERGRARRAGEPRTALSHFEQALELYRGDLLEDFQDTWITAPRQHLASLRDACLADAGVLAVELGDAEAGLARLRGLVDAEPLREDYSVLLMRALGSLGQHEQIEQEYERLSGSLDEHYATRPRSETRQAYREAISGR